jgi:hypothetical protein
MQPSGNSRERPRLALPIGVSSFSAMRFRKEIRLCPRGGVVQRSETGIVSAVRALEFRLARSRCKLRVRVPHEDAVSSHSKLAQR